MANKNRFYMYTEYESFTDDMTNEEAGILFKAILRFENSGEIMDVPAEIKSAWSFIRKRLISNREAYDAACESHRAAGENGGRPKTKTNQNEPNKPKKPNNGKTVTDIDDDIEVDNDDDDGEIEGSVADRISSDDLQRIVDRWNELPESVARVKTLRRSGDRWRMLRARIRENGVDGVLGAIDEIRQSAFLVGQNNRGWAVTFDWFVKPTNFQKISEGNYRDRSPVARSGPFDANEYLRRKIEEAENDERGSMETGYSS